MYKLYKWLYTRIGGRKWTFILKDTWHKYEIVWIIGLVTIGVVCGHHFDWITILKGMGIFTTGFIFGHLFWGKEYVPDQQE